MGLGHRAQVRKSMSAEIYPSTKALSVYNMLSLARRDLTQVEVLEALQEHWDPALTLEWVAEGVTFLVANGFALEQEGRLAPARPRAPDGKTWPLRRSNANRDLRWA
jgi:hypothetical protein